MVINLKTANTLGLTVPETIGKAPAPSATAPGMCRAAPRRRARRGFWVGGRGVARPWPFARLAQPRRPFSHIRPLRAFPPTTNRDTLTTLGWSQHLLSFLAPRLHAGLFLARTTAPAGAARGCAGVRSNIDLSSLLPRLGSARCYSLVVAPSAPGPGLHGSSGSIMV